MPEPTAPKPSQAATASPLSRQMTEGAAEARRSLAQRFRFGKGGFEGLIATATGVRERLVKAGASDEALARCDRARRVLSDTSKILTGQPVQAVPATNAEIYSAALTIVRLDDVTGLLGGPWSGRVLAWVAGDTPGGSDRRRELTTLVFAAACRRARIKSAPSAHADLAGTIDLNGWTVGLSAAVAPEHADDSDKSGAAGDAFISAAREAGERLGRARTPGLVLIEISDALPDRSRASRVDQDTTALTEMQAQIDRTLLDRRLDLARAANAIDADRLVRADDPAFGLIACGTMRSTIVSSVRVGFATLLRGVNLCELGDPRADRLAWFLDRFSGA